MDDHKIYIDPYRNHTGAASSCIASAFVLSGEISGGRHEGSRFVSYCHRESKNKLAFWRSVFFAWICRGTDRCGFSAFWNPADEALKKIKNRKRKQTSDADKKETLDDSGAWKDEGEPSDTYIETTDSPLLESFEDEQKHGEEDTESIQAASPENEEEILSDQDAEKERRWHETAEKLKKLFYNLGNKTRKLWDKIKAVYRRIMKIPEDMEKLSRKKDALCDKI